MTALAYPRPLANPDAKLHSPYPELIKYIASTLKPPDENPRTRLLTSAEYLADPDSERYRGYPYNPDTVRNNVARLITFAPISEGLAPQPDLAVTNFGMLGMFQHLAGMHPLPDSIDKLEFGVLMHLFQQHNNLHSYRSVHLNGEELKREVIYPVFERDPEIPALKLFDLRELYPESHLPRHEKGRYWVNRYKYVYEDVYALTGYQPLPDKEFGRWFAAVRELLDSQTAQLTAYYYGINATIGEYNLIKFAQPVFQQLQRTTPGLALMWHAASMHRIKRTRTATTTEAAIRSYREAAQDPVLATQSLKKLLGNPSRSVWRWLSRMPIYYARRLASLIEHRHTQVNLKHLLTALAGVASGKDAYKSYGLLDYMFHGDAFLRTVKQRNKAGRETVRAALRAFYRQHSSSFTRRKNPDPPVFREQIAEFDGVMQSLYDNPIELDENQKTAPWSWFISRWQEQLLVQEFKRRPNHTWESQLGEVTLTVVDDGKLRTVVAVPLIDSRALFLEGRAMKHCIASYDRHCRGDEFERPYGPYRIFSLRNSKGKRLSSVVIRANGAPHERRHEPGEHRTATNGMPPSYLRSAADELARRYNDAYKKAYLARQDAKKAA